MVEKGLAIVTTLVPHIGYDKASAIAKDAQSSGKTIKEIALMKTDFSEEDLDSILDPRLMTEPGLSSGTS